VPTRDDPAAGGSAVEAGGRDIAGLRPDPDNAARKRWEWALFRISTADNQAYRYGSCWRRWGIFRTADRWCRVTHLPNGQALTEFDVLRIARRFCEAIDGLADWSQSPAELQADKVLQLQVHRTALRLTGAKPMLRTLDEA
jgi:hypothetical protein